MAYSYKTLDFLILAMIFKNESKDKSATLETSEESIKWSSSASPMTKSPGKRHTNKNASPIFLLAAP